MKKIESGRSMIEMLGVLAIIGVLSIGGLAGYRMAMIRHRTNQVLDYVGRCAVLAQTRGTGVEAYPATTCGAVMAGETAPQGAAANYAVSAFAASPAAGDTFTITAPADLDENIEAALVGRTSANPQIAMSNNAVVFTFLR